MPGYSSSRVFESSRDNLTISSSSSISAGSSGGKKHFHHDVGGRSRRLSLMPPGGMAPPPAPVAPSTIHGSDTTSVIKHKINSRPMFGEAQEEYMTTKKVHVKTTKNTERLVKRQVVLEDGRVLEDEPPHVVVDTIEDTREHELSHLEDRDLDTEIRAILKEPYKNASGPRKQVEHKIHVETGDEEEEGEIIDDSFQRTVNSKDVKENIIKTQVAQDLGLLSRRGVERILRGEETLKDVLERRQRRLQRRNESANVIDTKPVVNTYQADSRRKIVDTEDVRNISRKLKNGNVRTETIRTEKHEIFDDKAAPDDDNSSTRSTLSRDVIERDGERYVCVKRDEFTDFFRVPHDDATKAEFVAHGPHVTTEEREILTKRKDDIENWEEVADERIRQRRQKIRERLNPGETLERTDALTKKPLNFFREEKTRKKETDRWLERHFGGSEWSLLTGTSLHTTTTTNAGNTTIRQHSANIGSLVPEINTRYDLSRDEKNLRRTQSFSSVPVPHKSLATSDFNKGARERILRQTTTTINPGLEKVVYSSVTKAVAAAPRLPSDEKEKGMVSDNQRLYRSALSLNNTAEKKHVNKREDKFFRGSTTSLIQPTREIPIVLLPDKEEIDESPTRPPRKVKPAREASKKDLFFDAGGSTPTNKLRTSTSYSELARTSMLNSNYFRQQKSPQGTGEAMKLGDESDSSWKRRSYYFGETLGGELSDDKSRKVFEIDSLRTPRTTDRRGSPDSTGDSYLRVQSEPPVVKAKTPQPIQEEIYHETPKVRRVYPTVERTNSTKGRIVYRSESKREPKRSQSQQPLYRTELRRNKLYPSPRGPNFIEDEDQYSSGDFLDEPDNNNNNRFIPDRNVSKSHHDLYSAQRNEVFQKREEKKYSTYFSGGDDLGPKRNNLGQKDYFGYRSVERSDGWDSPIAWIARSEKAAQAPRRTKSFLVGRSGGSAGDSTSHSSSTASNGGVTRHVIDPPPFYRSQPPGRERHLVEKSSDNSRHYYNTHSSYSKKVNTDKETLGNSYGGRNSPSSNILYHYDYPTDGRNIYGRSSYSPAGQLYSGEGSTKKRESAATTKESSSHNTSGGLFGKSKFGKIGGTAKTRRDVYEFEKKVPMHSSSLEAQKFKTIIFLSGH